MPLKEKHAHQQEYKQASTVTQKRLLDIHMKGVCRNTTVILYNGRTLLDSMASDIVL